MQQHPEAAANDHGIQCDSLMGPKEQSAAVVQREFVGPPRLPYGLDRCRRGSPHEKTAETEWREALAVERQKRESTLVGQARQALWPEALVHRVRGQE